MWAEAKARHEAGRIRAVEVRGSDYMGPGVTVEAGHVARVVPAALAGKTVRVIGRPDVPHSFTDVRDMARALVAVAGAPQTWGRVWHAPTNAPVTQAQAVADVCRAVGREPVAVKGLPRRPLAIGGLFVPAMRELRETEYQFQRPYVLDSSAIERELGLTPTPWDEVCRATAVNADPTARSGGDGREPAAHQVGVAPAAQQQLLVGAELDHRPRASTAIWSALRTVESRWAMVIVVRPSASSSSAACTSRSVSLSRALVASSSTRIRGLRSRVRAIASRCFSPPENRWPREPTIVS